MDFTHVYIYTARYLFKHQLLRLYMAYMHFRLDFGYGIPIYMYDIGLHNGSISELIIYCIAHRVSVIAQMAVLSPYINCSKRSGFSLYR